MPFRLLSACAALTLLLASGCRSPDRPIDPARHGAPVRVACVGDSITYGGGLADREHTAYPAQLGALLGPRWEVRNFGRSGATVLERGSLPYRQLPEYRDAQAFRPDVVVIMLGTNDTKPKNWRYRDEFLHDYTTLIRELAALPSRPRIWLCRPMPAWPPSGWDIDPALVEHELGALVARLVQAEHTGFIDQFQALTGHHDLVPDHVHPGPGGARLLAREVYRALTGRAVP